MNYSLFNRAWSLAVNDGVQQLEFDLNIAFRIVKTADTTPNECEITVYNLSDDSRNFIDRRNLQVILTAGYRESSGEIFRGNTELVIKNKSGRGGKYAQHDFTGHTWNTTMLCLDGGAALRNLTVSESVASGTDVKRVIERILKNLTSLPPGLESQLAEINRLTQNTIDLTTFKPKTEVKRGRTSNRQKNLPSIEQQQRDYLQRREAVRQQAEQIKLKKAAVFHGASIKKLQSLCDQIGLVCSINNQAINIYPRGLTAVTGDVIVISADTGMVGSPRRIENGYSVMSLLRHEFNPGMPVLVESQDFTGVLGIERLEHRGDTRSNDWYTELFCVELAI